MSATWQNVFLRVNKDTGLLINETGANLKDNQLPVIGVNSKYIFQYQFYVVDRNSEDPLTEAGFVATNTFRLVGDNDLDETNASMFLTEESTGGVNEAGDWVDGATADKTLGQVSVRIDTNTVKFQTAVASLSIDNPKDVYNMMTLWNYPAGESDGSPVVLSRFYSSGVADTSSGAPSPTDPNFLNETESDAKYVNRTTCNFADWVDVTLATGAFTRNNAVMRLTPETGATDDLDTISGMSTGEVSYFKIKTPATDSIVFKHGTGNLKCLNETDLTLDKYNIAMCVQDTTDIHVLIIPSVAGDMLASVYDPTTVAGDAFAMDNMVEGTTTKILTDAERTIIGNTSGTNTGDQDLSALALKSNVLELDNTGAFTPDADYEPATKKYVDDNSGTGDMLASTYDPATIAEQLVGLTTSQALTNKSVNGVTLSNGGASTNFLNETGAYSTPAGGGTVSTSGTPVATDFARFTDGTTIEGRSPTEAKTDLSLNNVENTAISTWVGSANVTTLGTVTTGTLSTGVIIPWEIQLAVSDEDTDLETGTAKLTFRMPYGATLSEVRASVTTAPTGSVLTVDINESGTTILSTKLTIDATEKTSQTATTAPVISDSALADDAEITIDIDTIGSTIAGTGLKVLLKGTRTI